MLKSIARLPFRLAKLVAKKIQDEDKAFYDAQKVRAAANAPVIKKTIPGHELADIPLKEISVDVAQAQDLTPFWLDVRTATQFANGHIQEAENILLVDLMIRLAELPAEEPMVCYCENGEEAAVAVLFLRARGFHQAMALSGGLQAWKKAGESLVS